MNIHICHWHSGAGQASTSFRELVTTREGALTNRWNLSATTFWARAQPRFKIGGVRFTFQVPVPTNVQLQRSKASRGDEWGRFRRVPSQPTIEAWGSVISAPPAEPQTILGRFVCKFMQYHAFLVHLRAAWLVGLIFPFNYFGGVRTPTTPTVAATLLLGSSQ